MLGAREDTMNPAVVIADLEFAILERESEISISLSDFSPPDVSPAREVDCAELSLRNRRDGLLGPDPKFCHRFFCRNSPVPFPR